MRGTFFTELRQLFRLAAPIAAAQAGTVLMGVVDTAVVGRLGPIELAAVGLGNSLFFTLSILGVGIVMAIDPLTSQAIGAGNTTRARSVMWQGVWLSVLVSIGLSLIMFGIQPFVKMMQIDAEVVRQGLTYLNIRQLTLVPMLVFIVLRSYLQAMHITRPMVIAMVVGNVFNFFADLLFVFGGSILPTWSGPLTKLPGFGVTGAAVATVLGTLLQLWIVVAAVKRIEVDEPFETRPDKRDMIQATRVGAPVGMQMMVEYGIFALVGMIAGRFGAAHLAAHQLAITLISFTFTVAVGIGAAGSVRVGRAVGAGDTAAARIAGLAAFCGGAGFMFLSSLVLLIFPRFFATMITNQPSVVGIAIPLLGVAAFFQLSDGIQGVGAGVLRGAADTTFSFVANIIGHWIIGFPTAIYLGVYLHKGVEGLWWGLCAGLTSVALMLFFRFLYLSSRAIKPLDHLHRAPGAEA